MLSTIMYSGTACIVAGLLFCMGQRFPTQKVKSALVSEGQERHLRRMLRDFIDHPWMCVHVRKGSSCVVAELVSGERRISLPHTDIPHGAFVSFIEYVEGGSWNVLTPYLGGLERWLKMTVYLPADSDRCDDT